MCTSNNHVVLLYLTCCALSCYPVWCNFCLFKLFFGFMSAWMTHDHVPSKSTMHWDTLHLRLYMLFLVILKCLRSCLWCVHHTTIQPVVRSVGHMWIYNTTRCKPTVAGIKLFAAYSAVDQMLCINYKAVPIRQSSGWGNAVAEAVNKVLRTVWPTCAFFLSYNPHNSINICEKNVT